MDWREHWKVDDRSQRHCVARFRRSSWRRAYVTDQHFLWRFVCLRRWQPSVRVDEMVAPHCVGRIALTAVHPIVRRLSPAARRFVQRRHDHPRHWVNPHEAIFDSLDAGICSAATRIALR